MARRIVSVTCVVLAMFAPLAAIADQPAPGPAPTPNIPPEPGPEEALDKKIAIWRFDALGIDPEIVQRLETLFRMELGRLDRQPIPSPRAIERATTDKERDCTGEEKCLAAIGKRLGVDLVVTGTVGSLGDNYVLTIKAVEVATAKSQKIQSDPLRGSPDDMIDSVRVAAYTLLAPAQLHGAVQIQTDLVGAEVALDGRVVGKTPLANQGVIGKLALGKHKVKVAASRYEPIEQEVDVHFQKVSPVLVHLLPSEVIPTGPVVHQEATPFYSRTWFVASAAAAAVLIGLWIGNCAGYVPTVSGPQGMPVDGSKQSKGFACR